MTHALRWVRAALCALAFGSAAADAATTAIGPYYASPSWDQTLPASTRFVVLANMNDAAVLDRETGLVWQRSPPTDERSWNDASFACLGATTGGRLGWRLPAANEFLSLIDPALTNDPPLPAGHPFVGVAGFPAFFWTATPSEVLDAANVAGHVDVAFDNRAGFRRLGVADDIVDSRLHFWCVRGSPLSSPQ
jgi:hypothetical protein